MTTTGINEQPTNLFAKSLGNLTNKDIETIKKVRLSKNGRAYFALTWAKINQGKYITFQQIAQMNPNKFLGGRDPARKKLQTVQKLYEHNLIEQNPLNKEEFKITHLGIKYLYCKKLLYKQKTT